MPWRKDARYLVTLSLLFVGFLLVMLLRSQGLAGSPAYPESAVPNLVQLDLENQQLASDNARLREELAKYTSGGNISALAAQQLQTGKLNAGLVPVQGPGIRITLDDSKRPVGQKDSEDANNYIIHEQYIRALINNLWNGGAEAIAINGQRVTTNTEVFCSGTFIQINGTRQIPPYVIEAVGDVKNLQAALNQYFLWSYLGDVQQRYGITRTVEVRTQMLIPAAKLREYHYAEPVKEG